MSSIEGSRNTTFLGQFKITNGVSDKVTFNDNATGFNYFENESTFNNKVNINDNVNIKGKFQLKNSSGTELVTINNNDGNNTISNKTILSNDLNILENKQLIIKNATSSNCCNIK